MFEFELTFDGDQPITITAGMRDVARWEMNGEGRKVDDLKNPSIASLFELAYFASRRQKLFSGTLDEFLDVCDLMPVQKENVALPKATRKGRTREQS